MTNYIARGRQVVLPLTNKSAGSVAAGDTVILSSGTAASFTTTTSAGQTDDFVGVVYDATIAQDAIGLVIVQGFVPLITLSGAASLGDYVKTHSVAKQSAPSATRGSGSFGQVLGTGTTPAAFIWGFPDPAAAAGDVATDQIWDAAGDLAVGTGANTAAKLTKGATGTVPMAGASTLAYAYPPGHEFDYVEVTTASIAISATTEAGATTLVTGSAVTYDGSTDVWIEFSAPQNLTPATNNSNLQFVLYDGAGSIGILGIVINTSGTNALYLPVYFARRIRPSAAAHTYSIRAFGSQNTGIAYFGAGGSGNNMPGYIRITKAA